MNKEVEKISCELCGERVSAIQIHLKKAHPTMTIGTYTERFPNSPLLSRAAEALIEAAKMKFELIPKPLAEVFCLKDKSETKTRDGKNIMVSVQKGGGYEELIPRVDPNYVYNVDLLKTCLMGLEVNIPIYLYGHSGIGKSTILENVCALTKRRFVRVQHTINTEESHIVGQWVSKKVEDKNGSGVSVTQFELGPLAFAMKYGLTYLADEYDRGHPQVLSVYQAVLEGKALFIKEADEKNRVIEPHPNFRFVATGNSNGSGDETGLYQATITQDAATFERFGICAKMEYLSKSEEIEIVCKQAGITKDHSKKVIDFCERIRDSFPHEVSLTPGPRVAINIAKIGLMKASFQKGVELTFANKLPESERQSVLGVAQRVFGQ